MNYDTMTLWDVRRTLRCDTFFTGHHDDVLFVVWWWTCDNASMMADLVTHLGNYAWAHNDWHGFDVRVAELAALAVARLALPYVHPDDLPVVRNCLDVMERDASAAQACSNHLWDLADEALRAELCEERTEIERFAASVGAQSGATSLGQAVFRLSLVWQGHAMLARAADAVRDAIPRSVIVDAIAAVRQKASAQALVHSTVSPDPPGQSAAPSDIVTPDEAKALLAAYPGDDACIVGYRMRANGAEPTITICGEELRSELDNGVPLWETAPAGEAAMRNAAPRMAATIARGTPGFSMLPIEALTPDDVRSLYPAWDETGSTSPAEPGAMLLCAFDVMSFGTPMRAIWVRVVEDRVVAIRDEDRTFWESTDRVGLLGPNGPVAWPSRDRA